jgi:hypothetical protein
MQCHYNFARTKVIAKHDEKPANFVDIFDIQTISQKKIQSNIGEYESTQRVAHVGCKQFHFHNTHTADCCIFDNAAGFHRRDHMFR